MAVLGVILLFLSLGDISFAERRTLMASKRCVATSTQRGPCHLCVCATSGVFVCRQVACGDCVQSNITVQNVHSLPEIREGDVCISGKIYKNGCNTCKCTDDGGLLCTKMACIDWKGSAKKGLQKRRSSRTEETAPKVTYLPKTPKGPCKPGKIYRAGCRRCFCTDNNKIVCSKKKNEACIFDEQGYPIPIRNPEDVRPPFSATLRENMETLASESEKCEPGKTYRVGCNNCICVSSGDLVCTHKLCISYEDMNRLEAEDMSGLSCTTSDVTGTKCVKCKCQGGVTECTAEPGCQPALMQKLSGSQQLKLEITLPHGKCVPDTVYKANCNKCYCQPDGTLRCTQRSCLNYSQITMLKKQRDYLEKHGL